MGSPHQVIGYARVSSTGQKLEVQLEALEKYGCHRVFQEKKSGADSQRPELQKLLDHVRQGDTVVITKMDRLGRSVNDLTNIVNELESQGVGFVVLDQSIDTTTPTGKLMLHMLAAVAEFELSLRHERQMAGIAKAQAAGVSFGRKKSLPREDIKRLKTEGMGPSDIAKALGIGRASVYRVLAES